jgi:hypothetical protein
MKYVYTIVYVSSVEETTSVNGVNLYYEIHGNGPALMLVAGLEDSVDTILIKILFNYGTYSKSSCSGISLPHHTGTIPD